MTEQFALVEHNVISEVVAARAAALAKMNQAIGLIRQGHADADEAEGIAGRAHGGAGFYLNDRSKTDAHRRLFESFDAERCRSVYREHLDARIWMHLLNRAGLSDLMDKTAKDKLYEDLCKDGVPEATEDNIIATFRHLASEAHLIFQRGLARAFTDLDRRFKSHDGFKLGARVVFTHVFDIWGQWNYHSRMFETLADVQRVFAILDGDRPSGSTLLQQIQQDRQGSLNPRQSETITAYFKVRGFKNGNAHLWFMRDDLVQKANKVLADYYGEVLPDAVPRPGPRESDLRSQSGALAKDLSFYPTPEPTWSGRCPTRWKGRSDHDPPRRALHRDRVSFPLGPRRLRPDHRVHGQQAQGRAVALHPAGRPPAGPRDPRGRRPVGRRLDDAAGARGAPWHRRVSARAGQPRHTACDLARSDLPPPRKTRANARRSTYASSLARLGASPSGGTAPKPGGSRPAGAEPSPPTSGEASTQRPGRSATSRVPRCPSAARRAPRATACSRTSRAAARTARSTTPASRAASSAWPRWPSGWTLSTASTGAA